MTTSTFIKEIIMSDNILDIISNIVPKENIKTKEELKKHTTFRIGGYADFLYRLAAKKRQRYL